MAKISDYLNTAKNLIHNAIEVIGGQSADNNDNGKGLSDNLQNKVDPIVSDEFVEDQSEKETDKI